MPGLTQYQEAHKNPPRDPRQAVSVDLDENGHVVRWQADPHRRRVLRAEERKWRGSASTRVTHAPHQSSPAHTAMIDLS